MNKYLNLSGFYSRFLDGKLSLKFCYFTWKSYSIDYSSAFVWIAKFENDEGFGNFPPTFADPEGVSHKSDLEILILRIAICISAPWLS